MTEPQHLQLARSFLGLQERPGAASEPEIDAMFRDVGHPQYTDSTAWCAAFVGAVLERSGIPSTRNLTARSYSKWGEPVDLRDIRPGDVIVTPRGDPSGWQGHVEFASGYPEDGSVMCIGGNEGNAVREQPTRLASIIDARRAPAAQPVREAVRMRRVTADARFQTSLERAKFSEGGYVNHPADRGGPTKYGITQATLADWRGQRVSADDVKLLTWQEASRIYRKHYWDAVRADELPVGLDYLVFDMAINHGPKRAVMILQDALGVVPDGIFGPATLRAVHAIREDNAAVIREIEETAEKRELFYAGIIARNPSQAVFRDGWANRGARVEAEALSDARGARSAIVGTSVVAAVGVAAGAAATFWDRIVCAVPDWLAALLNLTCGV